MNDHAIALQNALHACLNFVQEGCQQDFDNETEVMNDAADAANRVREERLLALKEVWSKLRDINSKEKNHSIHGNDNDNDNNNNDNKIPIDIVHLRKEDEVEGAQVNETPKNSLSLTNFEFKQKYIYKNIPCLIRGLDDDEFQNVSSLWRQKYSDPRIGCEFQNSSNDCYTINASWFLQTIGPLEKVPVKYHEKQKVHDSLDNDNSSLDEDGRAMECETVSIALQSWVEYSKQDHNDDNDNLNISWISRKNSVGSIMYLKDWHLQRIIENRQQEYEKDSDKGKLLYNVPSIFMRDLLNHFFLSFTDGDYRFVYWGPKYSSTSIHSDVLNSFSWSYNVVGEKKWIFYPPPLFDDNKHNDDNSCNSFEVIQKTGETVFVPSGWKHEVVNLHETLSINHNWVTAVSLDLVWNCILLEICAIEQEINKWGIDANDCETRENMLRGCCGLDVTSFLIMMLCGILQNMKNIGFLRNDNQKMMKMETSQSYYAWEEYFDLANMVNVVNLVMQSDREIDINTNSSHHYTLQLNGRIESMLGKDFAPTLWKLLQFVQKRWIS